MRSAIGTAAFYVWSIMIGLVMIPGLILPRPLFRYFVLTWSAGNGLLLRVIAGIKVEIRGHEHIPATPVIIASKHQSEWESNAFLHLLHDPVYVMKVELSRIPGYGAFARRMEMIFIDRTGGSRTLRALVQGARAALAVNRPIVIFPEGTRVAPGEKLPYRPGVAALYAALGVPVVPVALNSGLYWPKGSFRRYSGTIVLEFLPPIPPGLERQVFMGRLETAIEETSERLLREAGGPPLSQGRRHAK